MSMSARVARLPSLLYTHSMENQETLQIITKWLGTGSINIFGLPFAGKDTQGKRLAELFGGTLLGGGDILRGSVIPNHVLDIMHSGQLIPSDEYVRIVLPYLSQESLAGKPLILSSVGRWAGEENGVIGATEAAGHPLRAVILLSLSEDTVRARWQALERYDDRGGRHDDTLEILDTRLREFATKTLPVIDAYRQKDMLIEIDGDTTPDNVTALVLKGLYRHATSHA
jgi:adenylate kinase